MNNDTNLDRRLEQLFAELRKAFARYGRELAEWPVSLDAANAAPAIVFASNDPEIGYRLHVEMPNDRAIVPLAR
jgi:hypothetical protein